MQRQCVSGLLREVDGVLNGHGDGAQGREGRPAQDDNNNEEDNRVRAPEPSPERPQPEAGPAPDVVPQQGPALTNGYHDGEGKTSEDEAQVIQRCALLQDALACFCLYIVQKMISGK